MTRSAWKITYDPAGTPLVLLDIGDRLMAEPSWAGRRAWQIDELVRGAAPLLADRGNRTVELRIERIVEASTDAAARSAMLASLISIPALPPQPLRIEVAGIAATYWQFASAIITEYTPAKHIPGPTPRRIQAIALVASGLTETTV